MSADTRREILAQRAARLARPVVEEPRTRGTDVVWVSVEGCRYAFEAGSVRQVLPNEAPCRLPGGGALVGVTLAGGEAVAVTDLAFLVGLGAPHRDRPFLLILESPSPVGILVDEVLDVVPLQEFDLRPFSAASREAADLYRGMMGDDVVVLDSNAILADSRLVVEPMSTLLSAAPDQSPPGAR